MIAQENHQLLLNSNNRKNATTIEIKGCGVIFLSKIADTEQVGEQVKRLLVGILK